MAVVICFNKFKLQQGSSARVFKVTYRPYVGLLVPPTYTHFMGAIAHPTRLTDVAIAQGLRCREELQENVGIQQGHGQTVQEQWHSQLHRLVSVWVSGCALCQSTEAWTGGGTTWWRPYLDAHLGPNRTINR